MKNFLFSKQAKITVDILLVVGLIVSWIGSHHTEIESGNYWSSSHCLLGLGWILFCVVHIIQHWRMIRAFTKKKVILKNKITALTTLTFLLIVVSILFFSVADDLIIIKSHHIIGRIFVLMIIIHTIQKFKRFISLFKTKHS